MKQQYTVVHMFCGAGGGALGLAQSLAKLGAHEASFRTLGGIDNDPGAADDFERLVGARCIVGDVHAMQPADLHRVFGRRAPDFVLSSPPCKSFSALLSKAKSTQPEYVRMAELAIKGVHLMLAAWPVPPRLFFLENVPRIVSRGKTMLAQLRQVLTAYGYSIAEGVHDCGEVGGLAQHRRRWFLVARHRASLPRVVYQPPKRRVRGCGEVLGDLPVPLGGGGPMHQMPKISMLSWCRLAAIPAGGDWRDLPGVVPAAGKRREVHRRHMVMDWKDAAPTIGGTGSNGACAVADHRLDAKAFKGGYGVMEWGEPSGAVTGEAYPSTGRFSVADPRLALGATADNAGTFAGRPGLLGVTPWGAPAPTVTGTVAVASSNTPAAVADPRLGLTCKPRSGAYGVMGWQEPAPTIAGHAVMDNSTAAVADPRAYHRGVMGVQRWDAPSCTVTGGAAPTRGAFSVADPRAMAVAEYTLADVDQLLGVGDPRRPPAEVPIIMAADGTWHRPLTTLDLAALQGFPVRVAGEWLVLSGSSTTAWRERIGNAIPVGAARAIGEQMLRALLAGDIGQLFELSADPVWVAPHMHGAVAA